MPLQSLCNVYSSVCLDSPVKSIVCLKSTLLKHKYYQNVDCFEHVYEYECKKMYKACGHQLHHGAGTREKSPKQEDWSSR